MADAPFFLQAGDLPNTVLHSNIVNTIIRELILKQTPVPPNPLGSHIAIFVDDQDGKFKIKKSDGTIIILEDIVSGADTKVKVKKAGVVLGTGEINFTRASDFDVEYVGLDGETTIQLAENSITDDLIAAHTSTKITLGNINQLPAMSIPPADATYILGSSNANLPNSSVITQGTNVTISNAGGLLTINAILGDGAVADFATLYKFSGIISPSALAADTHNWAPSGIATANIVRAGSNNNARLLTGLTGIANQVICLMNVSAYNLTLKDESSSSTTTNRFALPGGDLTLVPDQCCILWYDGSSTRWRFLSSGAIVSGQSFSPGSQIMTRNVADLTFANTTAQQTVLTHTFAGNDMSTNKVYKIVVRGTYLNTSGSGRGLRVQIKFATTVLWDDVLATLDSSSTRRVFNLEFYFNNKDNAALQQLSGRVSITDGSNPTVGYGGADDDSFIGDKDISGTSAVSTTVSNALAVLLNHDGASSSVTFTRTLAYIKEE